ncbi:MFS transporter [Streptomyces sp. AM 2-1-1]|uniref:MFS transporter n=1 Tax=Streptomyces sp. AM 2-1-1 TaxID=3028709 RepID=UPI0023B907F0|nr:MFS transporter [Streptomyces sp. AM 2-1-1]WEH42096.1 MFS transporter [Streptomyces sp. AM 2-1-1]
MRRTTNERITGGSPGPHQETKERRGALVPVLAFAGITVAVMQTLLVPVIKDLPALLHTAQSNATWVMTATLLAGAVSTPIMGRLGDLHGKRRMLLASLTVMVIGSLVCAFTDDLVVMIVGRALQGFAMGAIPLGIGIMRDELPPEKLGSSMALMSSSIGVGGGLGMPGAALVAQHADWHALFLGSAGVGVVALVLTFFLVPEPPLRAPGTFDHAGAAGLSLGLVCLLLPVTKGSEWGWTAPLTLGLIAGALLILVVWGLYELRVAAPLVDLRTTARREVLLTNLVSIMVGISFYAVSLVVPQLLQLPTSTGYGLGQSMVVAGLCMAPLGLTMMFTAPVYARIAARRGPKVSLMIGLLVIAVGYGAGTLLMEAAWQTVVVSAVLGAGIGLAYSSLPALIIGAVDASETGAANGLNTLMRSIGTSASSAVIGMVLANTSVHRGGVAVPSMEGFRTSFVIATGAVLVGLVLAAFLPPQRPAPRLVLVADSESEALLAEAEALVAIEAVLHGGASAPSAGGPPAVAGSGDLRGRVLDGAGGPVARATVTLVDRQGRQAGRAVADDEGRYALAAAPGTGHVLVATAAGYAPRARPAVCAADGRPVVADLVLTAAPGQHRAGVPRGAGAVRTAPEAPVPERRV